jgi:hypothetical protein
MTKIGIKAGHILVFGVKNSIIQLPMVHKVARNNLPAQSPGPEPGHQKLISGIVYILKKLSFLTSKTCI